MTALAESVQLTGKLLEAAEPTSADDPVMVYFSIQRYGERDRDEASGDVNEAVREAFPEIDGGCSGGGGGTTDFDYQVATMELANQLKQVVRRAARRNLAFIQIERESDQNKEAEFEDNLCRLRKELPPETQKALDSGAIRAQFGFTDQNMNDEHKYVARMKLAAKTGIKAWSPSMLWTYLLLKKEGKI